MARLLAALLFSLMAPALVGQWGLHGTGQTDMRVLSGLPRIGGKLVVEIPIDLPVDVIWGTWDTGWANGEICGYLKIYVPPHFMHINPKHRAVWLVPDDPRLIGRTLRLQWWGWLGYRWDCAHLWNSTGMWVRFNRAR